MSDQTRRRMPPQPPPSKEMLTVLGAINSLAEIATAPRIAGFARLSRRSVSNGLRGLRERGLIRSERRGLQIVWELTASGQRLFDEGANNERREDEAAPAAQTAVD